MAIVVTHQGSASPLINPAVKAFAVAPTGHLIVAMNTLGVGAPTVGTVSGLGLTWTLLASLPLTTPDMTLEVWGGYGTATTGNLTMAVAGGGDLVLGYTILSATGLAAGAFAFWQVTSLNSPIPVLSLPISGWAEVTPDDLLLGLFHSGANPVAGSGFALVGGTANLQAEYRLGQDLIIDMSWPVAFAAGGVAAWLRGVSTGHTTRYTGRYTGKTTYTGRYG